MKYKIVYTGSFQKDYQRMKRRGKNMDKLKEVVDILAEGRPLLPKYREHILAGKYKGMRECHIEPDWLLVWILENDKLVLAFTRTGTHSDIFD